MPLRDDICNHQLRTVCRSSVAAVQAQIVGNGVIVIVELEAQADLCQPAIAGGQGELVNSPHAQFA